MLISVEGVQVLDRLRARRAADIVRRTDTDFRSNAHIIRRIVEALMRELDPIDFHIALRTTDDPIAILQAFMILAPTLVPVKPLDRVVDDAMHAVMPLDVPMRAPRLFRGLVTAVVRPWVAMRDHRLQWLAKYNDQRERFFLVRKLIERGDRSLINAALSDRDLFTS
jgi:hypothetical protein